MIDPKDKWRNIVFKAMRYHMPKVVIYTCSLCGHMIPPLEQRNPDFKCNCIFVKNRIVNILKHPKTNHLTPDKKHIGYKKGKLIDVETGKRVYIE
jgi:hypothetical protein